MGYLAACLAVFMTAPKASATRSSKPGFDGNRCKKAVRGMPAMSAARSISARRVRKTSDPAMPPKSSSRTAQRHSSSDNSRTSLSESSIGFGCRCAIFPYLTTAGLSQRNDAQRLGSCCEHTGMKPPVQQRKANPTLLSIVAPVILNGNATGPIQQRRLPQRNPMFRPVGRILSLVPVKLHGGQSGSRMVSIPLIGGRT